MTPFEWFNQDLKAGQPGEYHRPSRVLLVEDDLVMQTRFTRLIKSVSPDANVDRVATAEEAKDLLRRATSEEYDLVISDQFLEGTETGLDLWNYCKNKNSFAPFILTSGGEIEKYFNQFNEKVQLPTFLPKPFSNARAKAQIQDSLDAGLLRVDMTIKSEPWRVHHTIATAIVIYMVSLFYYSAMTWSEHPFWLQQLMNSESTMVKPEPLQWNLPEKFFRRDIPKKPIDVKKVNEWKPNLADLFVRVDRVAERAQIILNEASK